MDEPTTGKVPTVEELERVYLGAVKLTVRWKWRLVFDVEPARPSPYGPFWIVFDQPRSFAGAESFSGARLRFRGPSPAEDGAVFEFESGDGEASHEVKARIVAGSVAVQEVFRSSARAVSLDFFSSTRRLAELEDVLRGLKTFEVEFVEAEHPIAYTDFTAIGGTIIGSWEGCEARIEIEQRAPAGVYRLTTAYPNDVQEVFLRKDPAWLELARKFHPRFDALIASIGGTRVDDPD